MAAKQPGGERETAPCEHVTGCTAFCAAVSRAAATGAVAR